MNSKERVLTTFDYKEPDRVPGWLGASPEFLNKAIHELGLDSEEELRIFLGDDFRRVMAPYIADDPSGDLTPFGIPREGIGYGIATNHPLSNASIDEIKKYNWPDPNNVDISNYRKEAKTHYDNFAILGGEWSPFWHDLIDVLGMENVFIKMYMEPKVIHCALEKIMDYYLEVNKRILEESADLIDILFIGNDFGSQTGSQMGVDLFDQFMVPPLKQLADLGHSYGLKVMMHCCGGFRELIPSMIELGLDGLHAIQPSCHGMNLGELKAEFGNDIVFNGCIDSTSFLIQGTPDQVQQETIRVLDTMKPGGGFIAGASHDYVLEETPLDNIQTMFETIKTYGTY